MTSIITCILAAISMAQILLVPVTINRKKIKEISAKTAKGMAVNPISTLPIEELDEFIPLEIVDSKQKDPYRKFGIHFSGTCYACDLATLRFKKDQLVLRNICDPAQDFRFEVTNLSVTDNLIHADLKTSTLELKREGKSTVYKLIPGKNLITSPTLKLVSYYARKKDIQKFRQHDCGDFGG